MWGMDAWLGSTMVVKGNPWQDSVEYSPYIIMFMVNTEKCSNSGPTW